MLTFNRALFNTLVQAKDLFKVVLVTGPRNSGKKNVYFVKQEKIVCKTYS